MLLPETGTRSRPRPVVSRLHGWGRGARVSAVTLSLDAVDAVEEVLGTAGLRADYGGVIVRGAGRSYGDAAQLDGGLVLRLDSLRASRARRTCGHRVRRSRGHHRSAARDRRATRLDRAGRARDPARHASAERSPATSTARITGSTERSAAMWSRSGWSTPQGGDARSRPGNRTRVFEATLGGMGLTGAIVWAQARAAARRGLAAERRHRPRDEPRGRARAAVGVRAAATGSPGSICSPGGRGASSRAQSIWRSSRDRRGDGARRGRSSRRVAGGVLRPSAAFGRSTSCGSGARRGAGEDRSRASARTCSRSTALPAWPRLYGPAGFLQYQFVVPTGQEPVAARGDRRCCAPAGPDATSRCSRTSAPPTSAPLSFPLAGWTLALDLPRAAPGLDAALDRCDELVAAAGGRVYLSKDARLRPDVLEAMYPDLGRWRAARDSVDPERLWCSDLAQRTRLVG